MTIHSIDLSPSTDIEMDPEEQQAEYVRKVQQDLIKINQIARDALLTSDYCLLHYLTDPTLVLAQVAKDPGDPMSKRALFVIPMALGRTGNQINRKAVIVVKDEVVIGEADEEESLKWNFALRGADDCDINLSIKMTGQGCNVAFTPNDIVGTTQVTSLTLKMSEQDLGGKMHIDFIESCTATDNLGAPLVLSMTE